MGFFSRPYLFSYKYFINYFKNIDKKLDVESLVISSHFVYGWMPTIISLNTNKVKIDKILEILNGIKENKINLEKQDLTDLKTIINNSVVGTSKLLHFIAPENYAIWDSRIYNYIINDQNKKSSYGVNNELTYLNYNNTLREISLENNYLISEIELFRSEFKKIYKYDISNLRSLELIMFITNKSKTNEHN